MTESGKDARIFLSAEWRDLVMLNYEADAALLKDYVPRGTELDSFQGKTYASLVAFRFMRTKLFGFFAIPFHTDFDEVNLRFYVRRREGEKLKRGVVFICEIVPKRAIALLARVAYGENYVHRPMRHSIQIRADAASISAEYQWQSADKWCSIAAVGSGIPLHPKRGKSRAIHNRALLGVFCSPRLDDLPSASCRGLGSPVLPGTWEPFLAARRRHDRISCDASAVARVAKLARRIRRRRRWDLRKRVCRSAAPSARLGVHRRGLARRSIQRQAHRLSCPPRTLAAIEISASERASRRPLCRT